MDRSSVFLLCLFSLFLSNGVLELEASHHVYPELQSAQSPPANQPYRTAFHFQPPKNWINDPNGPMIYKGVYHLFYQYDPYAAVWGNITWAHSTSTDLINWIPHKDAIVKSQPSDINGCWSGSATILPEGKPVILYTGINTQNQQVQNLAMPKNLSDPFLVEWVKSPKNPLMAPTPMNGINSSSFRDPTTAWLGPDGTWRVVIGNKRDFKHVGRALLFRSKDFVKWTEAKHPLYATKGAGMWECPDFYPVSRTTLNGVDTSTFGPKVKHVLKASLDDTNHDHYTIGTYNLEKDAFIPDSGTLNSSSLRYDYGKYYASKTFFDSSKNRRILFGWVNESTAAAVDIKKGWSGIHGFPRRVWLDKAGKQLLQWPIVEILKLRMKKIEKPRSILKGGSVLEVSGITADQADVDIAFEMSRLGEAEVMDPSWTDPQLLCSQKGASVKGALGPFGLLVLASEGLQEYTAVFFRIFKADKKFIVLMCSDQSRSSKMNYDKTPYGAFLDVDPTREALSLRTLIDHSIVESFGGEGKACITARVYPTMAIDGGAHLYAFNYGNEEVQISRLRAWSMKKAKIN